MDKPIEYTIGKTKCSRGFWLFLITAEILNYKSWMNLYRLMVAYDDTESPVGPKDPWSSS
jgi:hypothetical protein